MRGSRKHCFVNIYSLVVLSSSVGCGLGQKVLFRARSPEIASSSRWEFSRSNKISTGYFYVLFL